MNARSFSMFVAGVAALIAVDATVASAQTTSTTRIPVTKEAPGEVVRVDTVMVHDTVTTMGRVDTVTVTGPTVTRYDTTTVQVVPAFLKEHGSLYFGLGAGVSMPYGSIRTVNEPGFNGQAQLGWQPVGRALGIRGDINVTGYAENNQFATFGARPTVQTGNLDLRLNLPIFRSLFGTYPHFSIYALGGGTFARYQALRFRQEDPATGGTDGAVNIATVDPNYEHKFGWNAGGGLAWRFAGSEVFVESRLIGFTPDRTTGTVDMAKHVPITLGFNWF